MNSLAKVVVVCLVAVTSFSMQPYAYAQQSLAQLQQQRRQYVSERNNILEEVKWLLLNYPRATVATISSGVGITNAIANYIEEDWGAYVNAVGFVGAAFCLWGRENRQNCARVARELAGIGVRLDRVDNQIESLDSRIARLRR